MWPGRFCPSMCVGYLCPCSTKWGARGVVHPGMYTIMKALIIKRIDIDNNDAPLPDKIGWVPALIVVVGLLACPAAAQTTGACAPAEAEAYLDVNNVRARIFNDGALFWKGDPFVYEVPKGGGVHALFNASIWVGGLVEGRHRVAAARYSNWNFWPGPLDDDGHPPADCAPFDHIYEITRADIAAFNETGHLSENLRDWPWHLGAPVLDGDGIAENYDLEAGDRPALVGDQMLWWVMNDAGNEHLAPASDSPPISMEVHGSAFAFHRPHSYIDTVTFYRYTLHYKGRAPLDDAYFGFYADVDLGNFNDDYVGSDSTLDLGYGYNADDFDDGRYGEAPPAIGYTFLKTPSDLDNPGKQRGMHAFACVGKFDWRHEEPITGEQYYSCLRGRWANEKPIREGFDGINASGPTTRFLFPGDPLTGAFWSMENLDGDGTRMSGHDKRFMMSTGPFTMQPGASQEIVFAIVWARGQDRLDSVRLLKKHTARLHDVADAILAPDAALLQPPPDPEPRPVLGFAQSFPNPFAETTTIRYSVPQEMTIRLRIYDVLGREVAVLVDARQTPGVYTVEFDGERLPGGVYVYRIEMDHLRFTKPMTLVR